MDSGPGDQLKERSSTVDDRLLRTMFEGTVANKCGTRVALLGAVLVGCARMGDKPPWWPKAKAVDSMRCEAPAGEQADALYLRLVAQIDMDDGHVQQSTLANLRAPKATPQNAELARLGECYSKAKDIEPEARGEVVVRYTAEPRGNVSNVCLVRTAIQDGELVDCVMQGVHSLQTPWLAPGGTNGLVSIDFVPETEAGYSYWYSPNEMRWWGNQPPPTVDGHQDPTDFSSGMPLSR
jgi:hypothetical protein